MTKCICFDTHQRGDVGKVFVSTGGTKSKSMMSKSWRGLQMRVKNRGSLATGTFDNNKALNYDKYVMLDDGDDDDDDEEDVFGDTVAIANPTTNTFPVEIRQDILFIPQWSKPIMKPESDGTEDICIFHGSDDELVEETNSDQSISKSEDTNSTDVSTQHELIGASPKVSKNQFSTAAASKLDPPSLTTAESIEEICGISFLRPGEHHRRKKYRSRSTTRTTTRIAALKLPSVIVSDSETEEDSSLSSNPEGGDVLNDNTNDDSSSTDKNNNKKQRHRSIRFMDEIVGQSLVTIHLIPWSEHDDPRWVPRPIRCRIEL